MSLYLLPFLYSFLVTAGVIFLILFICKKVSFLKVGVGKFGEKTKRKVCRLGGVAIIIGFLAAIFLDGNLVISQKLWGVIVASLFILIFGIVDDFFELDWKTQLLFQIAVAILVFIIGVRVEYVTNPFGGVFFLNLGKYLIPSFLFALLWIVLMINSMNWIDGVDGLSGGVSFIGALTIFFLSLKPEVNQPPVAIIAMALSGAVLGFLVFNFYPSRILAGTSGSMFMGFVLAALAIFAGTKIATALLIMAIPIIDAVWVIGERMKSGSSIFKSDNRHLHYKLLDLNWSQRKITLFFCFITVCIALIAVNTRAIGKMVTMALVAIIMLSTLVFLNRKLAQNKKASE